MSIDNALASVPVNNLQAAVAWYEKILERPADSRPMPEVVEWKRRMAAGLSTGRARRLRIVYARGNGVWIFCRRSTTCWTSFPKVEVIGTLRSNIPCR
jgi:hypothetical protein